MAYNLGGGSSSSSRTTTSKKKKKRVFKNDTIQKTYDSYRERGGRLNAETWYRKKWKAGHYPKTAKKAGIKTGGGGALGAVGRFASRVKKDVEGIVRTGAQIPSAVVREVNETLGYATGLSSVKPIGEFLGQRVPGQAKEAVSKRAPTFGDTVSEIRKRKDLSPLAEAPSIRMLPGAYTASKIGTPQGRKELGEHPGYTLLDVLPYAGKATQLATKGSKMAARASNVAAAAGRPAKAARIAQRGMRPHEVVMQTVRDAERMAVEKAPSLYGKTPGALLERSALGGAKVRRAMEMVGTAEHRYTKAAAGFAKRVTEARKQFGLSADDIEDLTAKGEMGTPGWRQALTDPQRGFLRFYESEVENLASKAGDELFEFKGEVFPRQGEGRLFSAVRKAQIAEKQAQAPLPRRFENTPRVVASRRAGAERLASEAAGLESRAGRMSGRIEQMKAAQHRWELANARANQPRTTRYRSAADARKAAAKRLRTTVGSQGRARRVRQRILQAEGRQARLLERVQDLNNRRLRLLRQADRNEFLVRDLQAKRIERAQRLYGEADELAGLTSPARFRPLIMDRVKAATERIMRGSTDPADWENVVELVRQDLWEEAGVSRIQRNQIIQEVSQNWRRLQEQGYDPVFVHHIPLAEAERAAVPRLIPHRITKPADLKRRAWDMRPWVKDASIALTSQAADWLRKEHATRFVDELQSSGVAKTLEQARAEALYWARRGAGKGRGLREKVDDLMRRNYDAYEPGSMQPLREAGVAAGGRSAIYLPKGVARAFEQMRTPPTNPSTAVLRFGQRLFRLSVLYLNPFYYIDNALSGALLTMARGGPRDLLMLPKAIRMLKRGELPDELSLGGPRMGTFESAEQVYRYRAGWALADDLAKRWGVGPGRVRRGGQKAELFMQNVASSIDDMWKASSYLAQLKRKKGLSKEAAMAQAIEHANKVLVNFDNMTPFERQVIRNVIPFASWSKHIASYVLSYPFDHPWRAAVISRLGQAVREDMNTELPERFLNYFRLGHDSQGKTRLLPASGVMPFLPVADMFTFQGFISRLDPRFQTILQAAGVDPFTAGPDQFTPMQIDPVSGSPEPIRPSILSTLLSQTVPQSELLLMEQDLRRYYDENPDRFKEYLMRTFLGKSVSTRNLGDEAEKYRKAQERTEEMISILIPAGKSRKKKAASSSSGGGYSLGG